VWTAKNRSGRNWSACSVWCILLAIMLGVVIANLLGKNADPALSTIGASIGTSTGS
jgi:hypothetical protein